MNGATHNAEGPLPRERSPVAVKTDNVIRRALRITDPRDPGQVADALRKYFAEDSGLLIQEETGLPVYQLQGPSAVPARRSGPSGAEQDQAKTDVERDFNALLGNPLLKDIEQELRGWRDAISSIVDNGFTAARFALDPQQRSRAYDARRALGDYARVARFVGALTPNMSPYYRQLAKSLDEVAALLLVIMGEALAGIGFTGGAFLLQVPASELQVRRDAVINALRSLLGTILIDHGEEDWPRGLVAYRQLLQRLDESGQSDLRALLDENHLAQVMDEMTRWAGSSDASGLRALGSMAVLSIQRFRRLIFVGRRLVDPESPPLSTFLAALQLFADGFVNASIGKRLLAIARPPILFYGLYGIGQQDDATRRMVDIIIQRGRLAELLDCYLGCDCGPDRVRCQVILDKLLYDVDRAVDYYSLGTEPNGHGESEIRAAGFGKLIDKFLEEDEVCLDPGDAGNGSLRGTLEQIAALLAEALNAPLPLDPAEQDLERQRRDDIMGRELCVQRHAEQNWEVLLHTMAPSCNDPSGVLDACTAYIDRVLLDLDFDCPPDTLSIPGTVATNTGGFSYARPSEGT